MNRRKNYDVHFRSKVAIEAIKNIKTITQIASDFKVHPSLINKWKKEVMEKIHLIFQKTENRELREALNAIDELCKEIGKLKVESDFLKKNF